MLDQHQMTNEQGRKLDEYVTIIGPSMHEVMRQFHDQGLDAKGFAITGRIDRHRFEMADADGVHHLFGGEPMLAATFMRRVAA